MPEYIAAANLDGSPHGLQRSTVYSSMYYVYMRASTVWSWRSVDAAYKPAWVSFRVDIDAGDTSAVTRQWLQQRGYCTALVKRWEPVQCAQCRKTYTRHCQQENHTKE